MSSPTLSAIATVENPPGAAPAWRRTVRVAKLVAVFLALASIPVWAPSNYWVHIASLAAIYWILVSGLNLVVGYGGQLVVGSVGLLAVGAYVGSILASKHFMNPYLALGFAAVAGAVVGFVIGLPSLRLKAFYFAMTTLGLATIVRELAVAWRDLTGGGMGVAGPAFGPPFNGNAGFYLFVLTVAALATYITWNVARGNWGRGLVAIRDAEVTAESVGVPIFRVKLIVFTFSGLLAGVAGALYASLQTYISPDAFTIDLSILLFVMVLIGGSGRILGPMVATVFLTMLPGVAAPLAAWSTFTYAALLLLVVLIVPGGIGEFIERLQSRRPAENLERAVRPQPELVHGVVRRDVAGKDTYGAIRLQRVVRSFGGVRALDGLDLCLEPGTVHGLIGPNGSGKTTALNIISGYYPVEEGRIAAGDQDITGLSVQQRARLGIARTFQTPRVLGDLTVLQNVMLGGYLQATATFGEVVTGLGRAGRDDRILRAQAVGALQATGLVAMADWPAARLQHTEQRFLEIARCLVMRPRFVLLDEPGAGLAASEIDVLDELVVELCRQGIGVLLVEHHADFVFKISDVVTVLDFGRVLASGTPDQVRAREEVIHAYLGM